MFQTVTYTSDGLVEKSNCFELKYWGKGLFLEHLEGLNSRFANSHSASLTGEEYMVNPSKLSLAFNNITT